jgi:hypothetical protein
VLALIPFAYLVALVAKYGVDVPFWDQWELVPLLEKSYQGTLSFRDLWVQQNAHRVFFPRLIMIILARFSGWNICYELAVDILIGVGIFAVIIYQIRMTMKFIGNHGIDWVIPIMSFMVFSLNQVEGWFFGIMMCVFLNVFAIVTGIVLLSNPVIRWWRFVSAMVLGIIASYSFANGLLYWFIGLFILFVIYPNNMRIAKARIVLWMITGFCIWFLYLFEYKPDQPFSFGVIYKDPLAYASFVLSYLGTPLLTFSNRLHEVPIIAKIPFSNRGALLVGFLGLIVFCHTIWFIIRSQCIRLQWVVPYISLSLFAIGSALLTALGRAALGHDVAVSSRYVTTANLFWISNVILLHVLYLLVSNNNIKLMPYKRNILRKYASFSIFAIVLLTAISSAHRTVSASNRYNYLLAGRSELLSLKEGDSYVALIPVYPNADIVEARLPVLRKYRLSLFRHSGPYLGPNVVNARVEPDTVFCDRGGSTLITASVSDPDDDFDASSSVVVDIPWKAFRNQEMYDDGTHGDIEPKDGVYSYLTTIPEVIADIPRNLMITATDNANNVGVGLAKLFVVVPNAIYVDNSDARFVCDDWVCKSQSSSDASGAYGGDFCYHKAGNGSCKAAWKTDIPKTGNYNIYAWWTNKYPNRATDAKFTIYYVGGSDTVEVDQMINGSRWNLLGTYRLVAGPSGHVALSNYANGYVLADAIKWEPMTPSSQ